MALTGKQYSIAAGEHAATVVEVGAGLRRYTHRGVDVTGTYADDEIPPRGCGAVLVPWPNRLRGGKYEFDGKQYQLGLTEPARGNAIHGLARWARWVPVEVSESAVTLGIDLVPQTGWLFQVHVEVSYQLDAATGLTVTLLARNDGTNRAPFGAGCHPYLSVRNQPLNEVTLTVPAAQRLVVDSAQLPVDAQDVAGTRYDLRDGRKLGELRLDDGFAGLVTTGGRGRAAVRTSAGGAELWFDASFGYLQVFTVDDLAHGVPAIAIEPMTCPADAFNTGTGLIVLEPGGSWTGSWGITPDRTAG
jgi:aldose 1-epimerase